MQLLIWTNAQRVLEGGYSYTNMLFSLSRHFKLAVLYRFVVIALVLMANLLFFSDTLYPLSDLAPPMLIATSLAVSYSSH